MAMYRVREGARVAHAGVVHEAGAILELTRVVGQDIAVAGLVDEVDASGALVVPGPVDDLERFRSHERVAILQGRLAQARARVSDLEAQLAAEERLLADAVKQAATKAPATKPGKTKDDAPSA